MKGRPRSAVPRARAPRARGYFIALEGPDGAGKSTHARALAALLRDCGRLVVLTREPGGTPFGDQLRSILLDPATGPISSLTELLLYESIRAHHVETLIRPALDSGSIVISDRFTDASVAYQGYGRRIPVETVKMLNHIATSDLKPDTTLLLDIDSGRGLAAARSAERSESGRGQLDRIEAAGPAFHRRVRSGYQQLAAAEPERIVVIRRRKGREATFRAVLEALAPRLPEIRGWLDAHPAEASLGRFFEGDA